MIDVVGIIPVVGGIAKGVKAKKGLDAALDAKNFRNANWKSYTPASNGP